MVRIACMTIPYMKYSFERALQGISQAGYQHVAFGLPHAGEEVPDPSDPKSSQRVKDLLEKYQLNPVMLISNAQLAPGQSLETAKQRIAFAKELGIEELLSVGVWNYRKFPEEPLPEEEFQRKHEAFVQRFREVGALAEQEGITITIKPHGGNTATARHIKQTLNEIGSAAVRASYDPGNVHYYEGVKSSTDFPHIVEATASFIAKDHAGSRLQLYFPIPGEGDVDFIRQFKELKAARFNGPIVIERVDGNPMEPMSLEQIDQSIQLARVSLEKLLSKAGLL